MKKKLLIIYTLCLVTHLVTIYLYKFGTTELDFKALQITILICFIFQLAFLIPYFILAWPVLKKMKWLRSISFYVLAYLMPYFAAFHLYKIYSQDKLESFLPRNKTLWRNIILAQLLLPLIFSFNGSYIGGLTSPQLGYLGHIGYQGLKLMNDAEKYQDCKNKECLLEMKNIFVSKELNESFLTSSDAVLFMAIYSSVLFRVKKSGELSGKETLLELVTANNKIAEKLMNSGASSFSLSRGASWIVPGFMLESTSIEQVDRLVTAKFLLTYEEKLMGLIDQAMAHKDLNDKDREFLYKEKEKLDAVKNHVSIRYSKQNWILSLDINKL